MHSDFRDEWLNSLAQRIQMRELQFDRDGLCQFKLDQLFAISIYKDVHSANLVLFGQIPVASLSAELIKQLLIENRNPAKQFAPVLSIDERAFAIEAHFKLSQEDIRVMEDPLGLLVTYLEYWRGQI